MSIDPVRNVGRIKEQVAMEHQARRKYAKVWSQLDDTQLRNAYNPNKMNEQLKTMLKLQDLCPYKYTGEGECRFVSSEMYSALIANCRCRRPRTEAHQLKCVQKAVNPYLVRLEKIQSTGTPPLKLPETSNAYFGWPGRTPAYAQWEQSIKYISPVYTMPGHRMTATPYDVLFIG